jgi:transcriptional regulator with AAA-type ATPase domain
VQEKLMTSLQTEGEGDNKGKFRIRKLGETKSEYVTVRPIFASNLPLKKLREKIMPDLYDRISQLVIEIPSIEESKIDLKEAFNGVWVGMQFVEHPKLPEVPEFEKWLKKIHLEGNYRTLQNMAINWHQGRLMKLNEDEVFAFVKKQIEQFHKADGETKVKTKFNFQKGKLKTEMEKEYRKAMYDWAKENYQGLTDKEIATTLGFSRLDILLR